MSQVLNLEIPHSQAYLGKTIHGHPRKTFSLPSDVMDIHINDSSSTIDTLVGKGLNIFRIPSPDWLQKHH
jgi:hypothetical protein